MANTFSFEICKDVDAQDISIEPVIASLNSMRDSIGEVDIIDEDHLIEFPDSDSERIRPRHIDIKQMADFALILTNKPLGDDEEKTRGFTYSYPNGEPLGRRIAILSTHENLDLEVVTDHEVGHLFNMVNHGETHDGHGHCTDEECMMHASLTRVNERTVYISEENGQEVRTFGETRLTYLKKRLCQTCDSLLAFNTQALLDAKQGKEVDDKLIFAAMARAGHL